MGNLSWTIRQWFRQLLPLAMLGFVAYVGWGYMQKGSLYSALPSSVRSIVRQIPVFGSRFARGSHRSYRRESYAYSKRGRHGRSHRRVKARRHRRR